MKDSSVVVCRRTVLFPRWQNMISIVLWRVKDPWSFYDARQAAEQGY